MLSNFKFSFKPYVTTGTTWFSPSSSKCPFQLPPYRTMPPQTTTRSLAVQLLQKHQKLPPFNPDHLIYQVQAWRGQSKPAKPRPSHPICHISVLRLFQALTMIPCWSTGAQARPLFLPLQPQHLCHHPPPHHLHQQGPHHHHPRLTFPTPAGHSWSVLQNLLCCRPTRHQTRSEL